MMNEIAAEVMTCKKCGLWNGRTLAVPGDGRGDARVLLVGEAPGRNEDIAGRPFVGSAGKKLDRVLAVAGVEREDVFITNVVKCRPPGNRKPKRTEADTCYQYLRRQIEAVHPEVVVLLGNTALKQFFPEAELGETHGRVLRRGGRTFFPTYHPASMIYNPSLAGVVDGDIQKLRSELTNAGRARE